jgi:Transmembrane family 220, helix
MTRLFRWVNLGMIPLFLLAAVVQWNDPDPARWMAIYGAAFAVSLAVALRGRVAVMVPLVVGLVALGWSLATIAGAGPVAGYVHMFDAWEMKSATDEEAREGTGLLIVAVWMFAVAAVERRG